ncbi:MAG: TIGR00269 family protein [Candidatus Altiarchaeota archaeon]|nr:TIGR00269 family protein [Candidatus Altiarchaeota archaeon]
MNCIHCGSKAYFELRYSGHFVCKKHFIGLFERRVKKTIRQNKLLSNGDHILVALSGGKDSMTCLKILHDITSKNPKVHLSAVTIDEGIRGKNMAYAVDFCNSLGVEHNVVSFKDFFGLNIDEVLHNVKAEGVLACSICGVLKRRLLNDFSRKHKVSKVATGHNLDDEIQSAFMNFMRSDHERMARVGPMVGVKAHGGFVPRIKILRECPEDEVKAYADLLKLPYFKNQCVHSKTSLRTTVKKMLDSLEVNHPGSKYQMLRSTDELASILRKNIKEADPNQCRKCGEPSAQEICKTCQLLSKLT